MSEYAEGEEHKTCFFLPGELTCHRCHRPIEDVFGPLVEWITQSIVLERMWEEPEK